MKKLLCALAVLALVGCQSERRPVSPKDYTSDVLVITPATFKKSSDFLNAGGSCSLLIMQKSGGLPTAFIADPSNNKEYCPDIVRDVYARALKTVKPYGMPDKFKLTFGFIGPSLDDYTKQLRASFNGQITDIDKFKGKQCSLSLYQPASDPTRIWLNAENGDPDLCRAIYAAWVKPEVQLNIPAKPPTLPDKINFTVQL